MIKLLGPNNDWCPYLSGCGSRESPDHTAGNRQFSEFMMHPSEMMLYHNIFHQKGRILLTGSIRPMHS